MLVDLLTQDGVGTALARSRQLSGWAPADFHRLKGFCMRARPIVVIGVTATVFAWSAVLVAAGQTTAVVALAPALALTVQQIIHATRSHSASRSSNRVDVAGDEEGEAP